MRILSYKELVRGDYPSIHVFALATEYVRKVLEEAFDAGIVNGAMILGSVARGAATELSDLDVFVVYRAKSRKEFQGLATEMHTECRKLARVPLELIPLADTHVRTGWHHIGPQLIGHLAMCVREYPDMVIAGDPLGLLQPHHQDLAAFTMDYCLHKIRTFEKGAPKLRMMGDSERRHLVEKAVDFPVYAGRMVQGALGLREIDECDSATDVFLRFAEMPLIQEAIGLSTYFKRQFRDLVRRGDMARREYEEAVVSLGAHAIEAAYDVGNEYLQVLYAAEVS